MTVVASAHVQDLVFGFCRTGRAFARLEGLMSLLNSDWDWENWGEQESFFPGGGSFSTGAAALQIS